MTHTFEANLFSDLFKDARGYRPDSGHEFYMLDTTDDRKQEIWDSMIEEFNEAQDYEKQREAAALTTFEARVKETRAPGVSTNVEAIKWILKSYRL
jgi:hypothetical protein